MTVRELDDLTTGKVEYLICDSEQNIIALFTRDLLQENETYVRNFKLFDKYADARIKWVYSINDIIRVDAYTN